MGISATGVVDLTAGSRSGNRSRTLPNADQWWILLLVAFAGSVALVTLPLLTPSSHQTWVLAYQTAAITLGLVLAAAALVHQHLTLDPAGRRLATAAVLVAIIALVDIGAASAGGRERVAVLRLALSLAASGCLLLAVTGPRFLRWRSRGRLLTAVLGTAVALVTLGGVILWSPPSAPNPHEYRLHLAATTGWLTVAVACARVRLPGSLHRAYLMVCAVAMAGASIAPVATGLPTRLAAAAMSAVALAVAVGGVGTAMTIGARTTPGARQRADLPQPALMRSSELATRHEVGNVLASLEAAVAQFQQLDDELPIESRRVLVEVVSTDLGRLRYLLDTTAGAAERFDLGRLVQERAAAARLRGGRVDLSIPSIPLPVTAVWEEVAGAIDNLLLNAEQHTSAAYDGGVRLELQTVDGQAVLQVLDDGPGVDPSLRPQLFQPGVTTRWTSGGSGLGLPLARDAVIAAGGFLREVPTDVGACFELSLPLASQATGSELGERA